MACLLVIYHAPLPSVDIHEPVSILVVILPLSLHRHTELKRGLCSSPNVNNSSSIKCLYQFCRMFELERIKKKINKKTVCFSTDIENKYGFRVCSPFSVCRRERGGGERVRKETKWNEENKTEREKESESLCKPQFPDHKQFLQLYDMHCKV